MGEPIGGPATSARQVRVPTRSPEDPLSKGSVVARENTLDVGAGLGHHSHTRERKLGTERRRYWGRGWAI
jgi:hypothetical protein